MDILLGGRARHHPAPLPPRTWRRHPPGRFDLALPLLLQLSAPPRISLSVCPEIICSPDPSSHCEPPWGQGWGCTRLVSTAGGVCGSMPPRTRWPGVLHFRDRLWGPAAGVDPSCATHSSVPSMSCGPSGDEESNPTWRPTVRAVGHRGKAGEHLLIRSAVGRPAPSCEGCFYCE